MENRHAVNIDTLPEEMMHRIQSFLSEKEAARTSTISKSWYNAWLTRPHLDFDQQDFPVESVKFIDIVKKTLQRYEESNLRIQGFRLWMRNCEPCYYFLAAELVVKAIRIGVTNLDLKFPANLEYYIHYELILPYEVLESETITDLSLSNCTISVVGDRKVRCSRLTSLSLCYVCLEGGTIWDIISGCPLIEKLVIYECTCGYKVNTIAGVVTCKDMLSLGPSVSPYEFQSLKCLQLEMVHINTLFFRDFSSKFPCLEDLIVRYCYGFKEIVVSSHSLECISFNLFGGILFRATFDVPSIRDFNFSGSCSSSLTVEKVSKEWKCNISVSYCEHSTASWFTDLKKLLRNLSLSRICLRVHTWDDLSENRCDYASDDQGLPTPVVDDLMLTILAAPLVPCAFLHVLFQSCHPKFLTLDLISFMTRKAVCDLVKLLRKTLMLEVSENVDSYVEGKWQPLPWKTLLDASTIPIEIEKLRFRLRWEQ